MFSRLPGSIVRAALVVMLIAMPSVMLSGGSADSRQIVMLVAIFAALFTIVEYSTSSPSLVEFRDAPPFNRVRFCALLATVFSLSVIFRSNAQLSAFTQMFQETGQQVGTIIDFPYSPVRLMVLMMPTGASEQALAALRTAAGISYLISLSSIVWFIILLRLQHWPRRSGAFNVWINLPTFDPTAGGDVVKRLNRDGQINIILGFLLPFVIPAIIKMAIIFGTPVSLDDPQTLIWVVTAWAFLPASLLMRGVALSRVAQMIYIQRKRAYAKAAEDGMLVA